MERDKLYNIAIIVLILLQGMSFLKISNIERQVQYSNSEINYLGSRINNEFSMIYSNIDERLNKEASLISIATSKIGSPNVDDLTVPITFTITPKEVKEDTRVSLAINGETYLMERNNTDFITTISCGIFEGVFPKIIIEENGVKKTIEDDQVGIWNIKEMLLPTISPIIMGEERYSGGTYKRKGTLSDHALEVSKISEIDAKVKYTGMRLVIKVDDVVISDKVIPKEVFYSGYEIDEEIPLSDGQTCTMTVVAIDSINLEHHYMVAHYVAGSNMQREALSNVEYIYSKTGDLLWKPEYLK